LIVRRFKPDAPVYCRLHLQRDGMQRHHVDTGSQQKRLLAFLSPPGTDTLRRRRDNVGEETLVLFVVVGEKTANGINFLVLGLEK